MTLFGGHTAAETADLIRDKDNLVQALKDGFAALPFPAVTDTAWFDQFTALQARYAAAKEKFTLEKGINPFVSNAVMVTENSYQAILRALQATEGVTAPGDAQDLYGRLQAMRSAGGLAPIDEHVVQPTATDLDLGAYKAADTAAKGLDAAAAAAKKGAASAFSTGKLITYGVIGAAGLVVTTYLVAKLT